jgi:hypothetical protein
VKRPDISEHQFVPDSMPFANGPAIADLVFDVVARQIDADGSPMPEHPRLAGRIQPFPKGELEILGADRPDVGGQETNHFFQSFERPPGHPVHPHVPHSPLAIQANGHSRQPCGEGGIHGGIRRGVLAQIDRSRRKIGMPDRSQKSIQTDAAFHRNGQKTHMGGQGRREFLVRA